MNAPSWLEGRRGLVLLALLTFIASAPGLANRFAYDDVPIILQNANVHGFYPPWTYLTQSYWSGPRCCALYRPMTIWMFAVQWKAGGGSPYLFHAVNVALIVASTLTLLAIARRLLPPVEAWLAAAWFGVHPVHVEAVANIVGQAEIWMTWLVLATVLVYLRARARGPLAPADRLGIFLLTLVASLFKEQGLILPAVLALAEWTVVHPAPTDRKPVREAVVASILGAGASLMLRFAFFQSLGVGEAAAAIKGLDTATRLKVVVGTVPVWWRLLLWPRDLSAEYSPPAYGPALGQGLPLLFGATCLLLTLAVFAWTWRRRPVAAFGFGLALFALAPVSNVVFPTGILVAERTLLLPSAGVVLALVDLGRGPVRALVASWRPALALAGTAAVLLLAAGTARSMSRQRVWRTTSELFDQMPLDSPGSFRAFKMASMARKAAADTAGEMRMLDRAIALWDRDVEVLDGRGQLERARHGCGAAVPFFRKGLAADPGDSRVRSRLFVCLLEVGDLDGAETVAAQDPGGHLETYDKLLARARANGGRLIQ